MSWACCVCGEEIGTEAVTWLAGEPTKILHIGCKRRGTRDQATDAVLALETVGQVALHLEEAVEEAQDVARVHFPHDDVARFGTTLGTLQARLAGEARRLRVTERRLRSLLESLTAERSEEREQRSAKALRERLGFSAAKREDDVLADNVDELESE